MSSKTHSIFQVSFERVYYIIKIFCDLAPTHQEKLHVNFESFCDLAPTHQKKSHTKLFQNWPLFRTFFEIIFVFSYVISSDVLSPKRKNFQNLHVTFPDVLSPKRKKFWKVKTAKTTKVKVVENVLAYRLSTSHFLGHFMKCVSKVNIMCIENYF